MANLPQTEIDLDPGPVEAALNTIAAAAKRAKGPVQQLLGRRAYKQNEDLGLRVSNVRRDVDRLNLSMRGMYTSIRRGASAARGIASLAEGPGAIPGLLANTGRMFGFGGAVSVGIGAGMAISYAVAQRLAYQKSKADAEKLMSESPMQKSLRELPNTSMNKAKLARESVHAAEVRRQTGQVIKMHKTAAEWFQDTFGWGQSMEARQSAEFTKKMNLAELRKAVGMPYREAMGGTRKATQQDIIAARKKYEGNWMVQAVHNAAYAATGDYGAASKQKDAFIDTIVSNPAFSFIEGGGPEGYRKLLLTTTDEREIEQLKAEVARREDRIMKAERFFADPTASFKIAEIRRQKQFLWQIQRPKVPAMRRD